MSDASTGWLDTGPTVFETDLTLPDRRRGKVRDVYRLPMDGGADRVVMVASDRLSAFDVVLPTPIPGKGRVLTGLAAFWLRWIEDRKLCRTHLLSTDADDLPDRAFGARTTREDVRGRLTIGRACRVVPVECVVRGYLEGSGWKDYRATGEVCGVRLPAGLLQCGRIEPAIFTPATKAEEGHDENIDFETMCEIVGRDVGVELRDISLRLYREGATYAEPRGVILADTKFEFGEVGGELVIIDEVLTPDSSRFWPASEHRPGEDPPSFDKQILRSWLETLDWGRTPPPPRLPEEIITRTRERYREVLEILFPDALNKWEAYL